MLSQYIQKFFLLILILSLSQTLFAQQDPIPTLDSTAAANKTPAGDTAAKKESKFNKFNKKMEALFKIIPVPIVSYSTEAGNVFGLAKFNLFDWKNSDSGTRPSKLSEVVTFSTKGQINASLSSEIVFNKNKFIILSYINYRKQPEYFYGIGNDIDPKKKELIESQRFRFNTTNLLLVAKDLYIGIPIDLQYYYDIKVDSNSYLIKNNVTGLKGGFTFGIGGALAYDSRDSRYNAFKGTYILGIFSYRPKFLGSVYQYSRFDLDARKYWNPWYKHVIAVQATTIASGGDVPYYDLAMMGGDSKMRGYYLGAYRDKVLVDAQVEYRMPVWNIFGIVAWAGTGRVAKSYGDLSLNGFKFSYGGGIRIRVDSKHNTNLRLDFGFGQDGFRGTYLNFAEAF